MGFLNVLKAGEKKSIGIFASKTNLNNFIYKIAIKVPMCIIKIRLFNLFKADFLLINIFAVNLIWNRWVSIFFFIMENIYNIDNI